MINNKKEGPEQGKIKEDLMLIVQNDAKLWEIFSRVAREEGLRMEKTADWEEAVRKAGSLRPALILFDPALPGCDPFQFLRELQKDGTADIPVALIYDLKMNHPAMELLAGEPNVKAFMGKPVEKRALAALLCIILEIRSSANGRKD